MSKTGNFWSKNQSRQWAWGRKRKWTHTDWTKGKCIMLIGITYIQYHMYSISTYKQCNWLIVRCIMSPLSFRGVALDRLSAFQAHSHSVQSNTHICREIGCSPLLRHGVNAHCIYGLSSAVTRSYRLLVAWLIQVLNDVCVCVCELAYTLVRLAFNRKPSALLIMCYVLTCAYWILFVTILLCTRFTMDMDIHISRSVALLVSHHWAIYHE